MTTTHGTAIAYAAKTLYAPVSVLRRYNSGGIECADVVTLPGGVGGWARPGLRLVIHWVIVKDFTAEVPAAPAVQTPARESIAAELPTVAERLTALNVPAPCDGLPEAQGKVVAGLRKRLVDAVTELAAIENSLANLPRNPGNASLRGKQHHIKVNAAIGRAAAMVEATQRLNILTKGLVTQIAEAQLSPVTDDMLKTARLVRDRHGWHEVVRVNKTTVSVATGYSWVDRIPHSKIVEVRA